MFFSRFSFSFSSIYEIFGPVVFEFSTLYVFDFGRRASINDVH